MSLILSIFKYILSLTLNCGGFWIIQNLSLFGVNDIRLNLCLCKENTIQNVCSHPHNSWTICPFLEPSLLRRKFKHSTPSQKYISMYIITHKNIIFVWPFKEYGIRPGKQTHRQTPKQECWYFFLFFDLTTTQNSTP